MKFGQLTEYNFFKHHTEYETVRLGPYLFSFFKKGLCKVKQVVRSLVSIYFDRSKFG